MKYFPACLCCLAVIGSGVASGLYTNRWEPPADFGPIQARMDSVPTSLGPWVGRPVPVEQDALDMAGIRAHLSREYTDSRSGRSIQALLVAGRPGPIAVHTPDVCFRGAGYEQTEDANRTSVGPSDARFWRATFVKTDAPVPTRIAIYWGWNGGDGWEAADHRTVRVNYSLRSVLYKLYLVTDLLPTGKTEQEAFGDFPDQFLPELVQVTAPPQ